MTRKESDRRKEILEAAVKVFARNGFFLSKVSDVARAAGVADGTIYLYFRNKDDLLISIFDQAMGAFVERARNALAETTDPVEQLRRLAWLHLDGLGQNRELAIVFQIELRHSSKFMARFSKTRLRDYFDLIHGILRDGQSAGYFRKDLDERMVAKCFFGSLDEMATNWILSRRRYKLSDLADVVVKIFVQGLTASERKSLRHAGKIAAILPVQAGPRRLSRTRN